LYLVGRRSARYQADGTGKATLQKLVKGTGQRAVLTGCTHTVAVNIIALGVLVDLQAVFTDGSEQILVTQASSDN
jgi:hypothetical protein